MKPNFALDLSHDGIGLVHRGKGGWVLVGEVSLDHPDLSSGLDLLRRKAADLESGGFSCKLIIPPSQLLFTSMTAPGPDDATRVARIREGLEGLTPYDVDDLVFDWRADPQEDGMVHVAVVARETLDEAETFANEHKLNPLSFVARPSGSFEGEAFFGPTNSAVAKRGATVEPDNAPVPAVLGGLADNRQAKLSARDAAQTDQPATAGTDAKSSAGVAPLPELAPFPPTPDVPAPSGPSAPPASAPAGSSTPAPTPVSEPLPEPSTAPVSKSEPQAAPVGKSEPAPVRPPAVDAPAKPVPTASPATPDAGADAPSSEDTASQPAAKDARTKISGIVPPPPPPLAPDNASEAVAPNTSDAPTFSSRRTDDDERGKAAVAPDASSAPAPEPTGIEVKPRLSFGVDRTAPDGKAPPSPAPADPPVQTPVHVPVTAPVAFGDDPALTPSPASGKRGRKEPDAGDRKGAEKLTAAARKGASGLASAADAAGKFGRKAAQKFDDRRREKSDAGPADRPKVSFAKLRKRDTGQSDDSNRISDTAVAPPPPRMGDGPATPPARASKPARAPSPRAREAETMTVFGARQTQAVGGKPRYLGLFLVLGLLLLMAIVAIWSMFFLNDSTTWLFPERDDPFEAAISVEPDASLSDDAQDDIATAPDGDADPSTASSGTSGAHDPLTPEAAQARYAATGIWQRAPEPLTSPETTDLDDLYIASIDPATTAQDAVALPDATLPAGAAAEINTAPPPPLGTTFALDENGLVIATPDGALTPEGIMVFAGKPALVPAPRPGSAVTAPATEATVDATTTLPRVRPRARPEGLIEGNERLLLGGRTRTELAVLRPRARPTTPQAAVQAAAITAALQAAGEPSANQEAGNPSTAGIIAPTEQAIATSLEPRHRPSGFNRIVARSNAARDDASDGSVAVAAASAQQSVTPSIPTRTSVAKQATIKNAINLRKISLIGIYGSSSSRRALVRLPSGRYQKVGVGSRLDGGKVVSISATALVYKKGSRSITLKVLPFG
ncbi:hypothetical protein MUY21_13065 [Aliiroseovarius sp. S2029]|uniref:hypothetical protein n=1 Tax=Aliiroseovarius sp. S2029 TaxID=2936988 RepID=UPI0020BDC8D0|nr:hypothetical protein [Aliiroseovarius sp. S2029]MCK8484968.1 hypothetical protein [Aliiroseovarius sp. S2029]